jgi:hypothetical protein
MTIPFFRFSLPIALFAAVNVHAVLIPASRLAPWSPGVAVGVSGGIPVNRTHLLDVTQAPYNADSTGATDCHDAILAAMNAAHSGDVVYLPAGHYLLSEGISLQNGKSNYTIRGTGDTTVILWNGSSGAAFYLGSSTDYLWSYPTGGVAITGGLSQGSTVLTVANTTSIIDGGIIQVTENNDPALPAIHVSGVSQVRTQKTTVISHTATTVTISQGLYWTLQALLNPIFNVAQAQGNNIGIENFMIDATGGTAPQNITLEQCNNSWIYNVHSKLSSNYHIYLYDCFKCQVDHCFLDQLNHSGTNGSGLIMQASSACLIQNNIIYKTVPSMEINFGCCGNVFGYNFCYDCTTFGVVGPAIDSNHGPHNSYNLYEGNITPNIQCDGFFGSASEDTVFRNWLHGTSPGVANAREPILLNRFTRNYNVVGNLLGTAGTPYFSITGDPAPGGPYSFGLPNIGNTSSTGAAQLSLGTPWADWMMFGTLTTVSGSNSGVMTVTGTTGDISTSSSQAAITWATGRQGNITISSVAGQAVSFDGGGGSASLPAAGTTVQLWAGPGGFQELDLDVQASLVLKDNFDIANNVEPSADQPLGGDTLPNSYYLGGKPSWFGATQTWPTFNPATPDPDIVSGAVSGGYPVAFTSIPAGYRFVNGTDPQIAPYIQGQPSNTFAAQGANATFTVVGAGFPVPSYQWQVSTDNGTTWNNLTESAPYSNTATSTLTITGVTAGLNTYQYRAVATNGVGTPATSGEGTLSVGVVPSFTTEPTSQTVATGTTVQFTVGASGLPAPTFQWQRNSVNLVDAGVVSGSATATLTLTGVTGVDAATYSAIATNSSGSTSSTNATLAVTGSAAPTFTSQPSNQTALTGANITFTIADAGTPIPALQWQVSTDGGSTWTNLTNVSPYSNVTTASLTITGTVIGMNTDQFRCTASNGVGPTVNSSSVTLTVNLPPSAPVITIPPAAQNVLAGGTATFTVTADGVPSPSYRWQFNGANLSDVGIVSGSGTATLTLTGVSAANQGSYTVVVSNGVGSPATSTPVSLTVTAVAVAPSVVQQPVGATIVAGGNLTLTVAVSGVPTPSIQWQLNGVNLVNGNGITGATSLTLKISALSSADSGTYTAVVSNGVGSAVTTTAVVVNVTVATRIVNISVRALSGPGAQTLIAGFAIEGGAKSVLIRAIGPSLAEFSVPNLLNNPSLSLDNNGQMQIASNTVWGGGSTLAAAFHQDGAFALAPTSVDSALVTNLSAGTYTALVTGTNTGTALAEIYDNDNSEFPPGRFINISARGQVNGGTNVLIAGFSVSGTTTEHVLIRAVGPGLGIFDVPGYLSTPELQLFDGNSNLLQSNTGWGGTTALQTAFSQAGAFQLSTTSTDSALVVTLHPGSYTAVISGVNGSSGIALVEIYELP